MVKVDVDLPKSDRTCRPRSYAGSGRWWSGCSVCSRRYLQYQWWHTGHSMIALALHGGFVHSPWVSYTPTTISGAGRWVRLSAGFPSTSSPRLPDVTTPLQAKARGAQSGRRWVRAPLMMIFAYPQAQERPVFLREHPPNSQQGERRPP